MKILILMLISMLPMQLLADQEDPLFDDIEKDQHIPTKEENRPPEKLSQEGMPEYPLDKNLRELSLRQSKSRFFVDIASLTSSKKDNVARLTTVAISPYGARTVSYEGFDCGYRRFMAYGYAGAEGPVRPFKEQVWRPVVDEGKGRYRATLIDNYLCSGFSYAASRKKILNRMRGLKPYKRQD